MSQICDVIDVHHDANKPSATSLYSN